MGFCTLRCTEMDLKKKKKNPYHDVISCTSRKAFLIWHTSRPTPSNLSSRYKKKPQFPAYTLSSPSRRHTTQLYIYLDF